MSCWPCGRGAVRREREPLAVGREHREAVEARRIGDALEVGAVDVDRPDVELAALGVAVVRREEDALAVRVEERRERGGVEIGDLRGLRAVGVGHVELELRGPHEPLREQALVVVELLAGLGPRGAPDDLRAVGVEERAAVAPFWHPGKRILFSSNHGDPKGREFDIWAIDIDGTGLERITYASGFDGFPMFSPDGKRLAFSSNRATAEGEHDTNVFLARWVERR